MADRFPGRTNLVRTAVILLASAMPCLAQVGPSNTPDSDKAQPDAPVVSAAMKHSILAGRPSLFPTLAEVPTMSSATPAGDQDRLGTATPKAELFLGYRSSRLNPGNSIDPITSNGGRGSVAWNLNPRWGLVAGLTGSACHRDIGRMDQDGRAFSFLFGPKYSWRNWPRVVPFVQTLLGGSCRKRNPGEAVQIPPSRI